MSRSEPSQPLLESAARELAELDAAGLRRRLRSWHSDDGVTAQTDRGPAVLFCGNDYLGLAGHPSVRAAAADAVARWGWGAGAARLISGTRPPHIELEARLAEFEHAEAALSFPTGYQANLAAVAAVAGPDDVVLLDKLNHASLIDAARLSGARVRVYAHNDVTGLAELLGAIARGASGSARPRRVVIVTDGVFSMDGDVARLGDLAELADRHRAILIVDEAHGTGVLGPTGRGAAERAGVAGRVDLTVGTLSKALGGIGGFTVGRREWVELVLNRGRAGLFTTAAPPAAAAAASAALAVLVAEPARRARLGQLAATVRAGVRELFPQAAASADTPAESPIIPVILGEAHRALAAAEFLAERGVIAPAVRPPTVPVGFARLRLTVSSAHSDEQVARLLSSLAELAAAPEARAG